MASRQRVLSVLGWTGLGCATLAMLVRAAGSGLQPLVVLTSFAPYGLLPAALGLLAFAALRSRAGTLAGVVVLGLSLSQQAPLYIADHAPTGTAPFTVLTGNLRMGDADERHIVDLARRRGVDAVALQELTPAATDRLVTAGLSDTFPYSVLEAAAGADGVGIWSRHPIISRSSYSGFTFRAASATIALDPASPASAVTVFSTHVVAPWPGPTALWTRELRRLAAILDAVPGATVTAGDFNATNDHAQFRRLLRRTGYADSAAQAGAGVVRTYPADTLLPPLIGIDHVLTRGIVATGLDVVTLKGSDHRGLVVELAAPVR
jgi:endonuclease/exonuclease/phosphatase (EEP) superfamily protein YafD